MSLSPPKISVIVPAYNAAHYLVRSLPPLIAMRDRGEVAEVIVVDDCSPNSEGVEIARQLGATVLRMKQNGGPGAARNLAAKEAAGDILWLVDADVVAHETGAALIKEAFADDRVAAVFGSYDRTPPVENFASQYKNLVHRYYHQRGREQSDTFWSGCGAVRKSVYFDLGGFDGARYGRPSIEDIEFGFRMRRAGWSIRLLPALLGTHLKPWTLPEVVKTDIFQRAVPWSYLILSGQGMSDDLNVSAAERVKAVVAGLWFGSLAACLAPQLWPVAPAAAAAMTLVVFTLNRDLLGFFRGNRGAVFALVAAAYHQIYYVYSAATFAVCMLNYHLGGKKEINLRPVGDREAAV
jgi:glycosyltransferase involved in cell wall biosynthesis